MKMIITGPPGAGKGTMSRLIHEYYDIPIISTGEILREEIKNGTDTGRFVKSLMEKGDLVPDIVVIGIIKNVTKHMTRGYLLDGFPRNISQAVQFDKMLEENNSKLDLVINIIVNDELIVERVKKRLVCPKCSRPYNCDTAKPVREGYCDLCNVELVKRKDDTEESIRHRLEVYYKDTKPLIDYYSKNGILFTIESGSNDIDETFEKIKTVLSTNNCI